MHDENEIRSLKDLENYSYVYLGRDGDTYYVLERYDVNWEKNYVFHKIETLTDDDIRDAMRQDFDWYERWREAVADWDTEQWYSDWENDVDIWEEMDSTNYYGCDENVVYCLRDSDSGWHSSYESNNWYYLSSVMEENITPSKLKEYSWLKDRIDRELRYIDYGENHNEWVINDIQALLWVNEIEFLACEDIR